MTRTKRLTCAVCGGSAIGRQWWNRDTGFGVCSKCIDWLRKRGTTEEEIHSCYGVEGEHYNAKPEEICAS